MEDAYIILAVRPILLEHIPFRSSLPIYTNMNPLPFLYLNHRDLSHNSSQGLHDSIRINVPRAAWNLVAFYKGNDTDISLKDAWTSQVGQDRTIADVFNGKEHGFFIDLASNDAKYLSNTLALEQMLKWRGLCIEANPLYTKGYLHRTCQLVQAVVGPVEDEAVSFRFDNGALGGIVGEGFDNKDVGNAPMRTVSVGKILKDFQAPSIIDYMSLDIEGAEAWAFQTFPWKEYTFPTLTVERPKPELVNMLTQNGYTYLCDHGGFGDQFWVHPRLPNFENVVTKYKGRSQCRNEV